MSDAIRFLEAIARDPRNPVDDFSVLRGLTSDARRALLRRDPAALVLALGGRATMACAVMLPDSEEPAEMPNEPAQVPDEPEESVEQKASQAA